MDIYTILAGVSGLVVLASFVIYYLTRSSPEPVGQRISDELAARKEDKKSKEKKDKSNKKSVKKSNKEEQAKSENKSPKNAAVVAAAKTEQDKQAKKSSFGVAGGRCPLSVRSAFCLLIY